MFVSCFILYCPLVCLFVLLLLYIRVVLFVFCFLYVVFVSFRSVLAFVLALFLCYWFFCVTFVVLIVYCCVRSLSNCSALFGVCVCVCVIAFLCVVFVSLCVVRHVLCVLSCFLFGLFCLCFVFVCDGRFF